MKILAVSDSHGDIRSLEKVVSANPDCDIVLHAGDYARDARHLAEGKYELYYVKGNCDRDDDAPEELMIETQGIRILLVHGDRYSVKYKLNMLAERAIEQKADITVFGHTHKPLVVNKHGAFMLNPGTVSVSKSYGAATYAVITIDDGDITAAKIVML